MMSKKSPQLRFEGFTDDWEERKLSEIADIMDGDRGKNYPNGDDFSETGHTLFMSATNVTKNGFKFDEAQYISEEKSDSLGNGKIIEDDLILTSRGTVGNLALYDADAKRQIPFARINSGMLILRKKQNESAEFVLQYLKSLVGIKQLNLISFGSAQPQITKKDISKYKVQIPNFDEQTKIGTFFKQLDTLITLHQRKLDLLKEQKKGFLQKMFPKNGAKVPELRFAGFADDWELRKSKELCTISTGKGNTQDKVDDGAYPFYVRSATIEKSDEYLYDQEAILTVGDGVGTGKVYHYVNGKYNLHQRVYRMYDFKDVSAKYFYYYFSNNFYKRVMSMTAKTSVDSVRMEMIADMNIVFPSVKEQENIVELFSNLDNTIALHQRKLDLLKEQKKGFLQKMFV